MSTISPPAVPPCHSPPPGGVEITIPSSPQLLPVVRAAVRCMAESVGFGEQDGHSLAWALDEALANIIRHGYENRCDCPITMIIEPVRSADDRPGLRVMTRDVGRQVDPATIRGRDLADVRPGGLGVHIIRSVMDEVEYSCPPEGGMLLTMIKYVPREAS